MSDTSIVHVFLIIVTKKNPNLHVAVDCYYKLWWNQYLSFIFDFLLSFLTLSFLFFFKIAASSFSPTEKLLVKLVT